MLPLPCCTDPDQVPATVVGSVTVGDGDGTGLAGPDGGRVCGVAGWLADSGLTACGYVPELALCSACTATPIASTQTVAAAAQPIALARRGRAAAPGRAAPDGGSAGM